jgi:hypothetical protein
MSSQRRRSLRGAPSRWPSTSSIAYVAREHHEHIDREKVTDLVRRKFNIEGRSRRYRAVGIRRPADLVRAFADTGKLRNLREDWEQLVGSELLFLPGELAEDADATLMKVENVERQAIEFWQPTLDLLR